MKISFNSVTFYQDKYEVFFKKISESSYDAIELNAEALPWATPHVDDKTSNEELDNISDKNNALIIAGLTLSNKLLNDDSKSTKKESVDYSKLIKKIEKVLQK